MDEAEKAFRDALSRIDKAAPPLRPIRPAEIDHRPAFRPVGRWLIGAAAVLIVAGIGIAVYQSRLAPGGPVSGIPAAVPSATAVTPSASSPIVKEPIAPSLEPPTATPSAYPLFEKARRLPGAPAKVRNPANRITCGAAVLDQGGVVPQESLDCLTRFAGVDDVEFQLSRPTVEGDPIISFVIGTEGSDEFEIYTTSHWDKYGKDEWRHTTCPISAARTSESLLNCV